MIYKTATVSAMFSLLNIMTNAFQCSLHAHTKVHWHIRSTQSGSISLARMCVGFVVVITETTFFFGLLVLKTCCICLNNSSLMLLASHAFFQVAYAKDHQFYFNLDFFSCVCFVFGNSYRELCCIDDCDAHLNRYFA